MTIPGLRPQFETLAEGPPDDVQRSLLAEFSAREQSGDCELRRHPGFLCIRVPEAERHFWSPRLHLHLERGPAGDTRIEGVYGPNANVWALFLYGYLTFGSGALFGGVLGFAQCSLGRDAWGLAVFAAGMVLCILLFGAGRIGRRIGAAQTAALHRICEQALGRTLPPP